MMAYSEKTNEASKKYKAAKIKRIPLDGQIADFERIKDHSQQRGESMNGFIKRAISETMERDKLENPSTFATKP